MKELQDIDKALEEMSGMKIPAAQHLSYQSVLHKITISKSRQAPKTMVLTVVIGIAVLLSLNLLSLQHNKSHSDNNLVKELGLMQTLSIYGGL